MPFSFVSCVESNFQANDFENSSEIIESFEDPKLEEGMEAMTYLKTDLNPEEEFNVNENQDNFMCPISSCYESFSQEKQVHIHIGQMMTDLEFHSVTGKIEIQLIFLWEYLNIL